MLSSENLETYAKFQEKEASINFVHTFICNSLRVKQNQPKTGLKMNIEDISTNI